MLVAAVVLWIAGIIGQPLVLQYTTIQQRTDNAILGGLPTILIIIGIIVAFIDLIILLATLLNNRVPEKIYNPILTALICGIVAGVVGMFQPFLFELYQIGFGVLFVSLIGFMVWSHIVPKGARRAVEVGSVSITQVEQREAGEPVVTAKEV
jgi:hypothetical protein